ncbi:hypothetical protein Csa_008979 [Cucumis sativus]|uniref:Uncharacterized protein n=1 Tax=Cucumis sativus TaxID=3659 RepID=A0A0A0KX80_CUCSA|nr:hypothetical protein Csa_008979 [Cucumis sativus]
MTTVPKVQQQWRLNRDNDDVSSIEWRAIVRVAVVLEQKRPNVGITSVGGIFTHADEWPLLKMVEYLFNLHVS